MLPPSSRDTSSGELGGCVDENTLGRLVEGSLDPAVVERVERHIDGCRDCYVLLNHFARAFASDADEGARIGRYEVRGRLGAGGMGVVYLAHDPELEREVALKLLHARDPEAQPQLLNEARTMARISHPNVVAVHDVGVVEGRVFIASELVRGETLADWLARAPRSWREVLGVFLDAGRGLAAIHAAGLVHGDFKPGNVLLSLDGRVRVADLGLARGSAPSGQTVAMLAGTPRYMAPEQLAGAPATATSDQFSFCVALHEGLHGARPGDARARADADDARDRPRPGSRPVPGWLRRAVRRGLAEQPHERFPDMASLLSELERAPARRRLVLASCCGVALLGATAAAGHSFAGRPADDPCSGGEERIASVWDARSRVAVERAFAATGVPFAGDAARSAGRTLDAYVEVWTAAHRETCEATHVHHEQSQQRLDERMACLKDRRAQLDGLVRLWTQADPDAVTRAVQAAHGLPTVESCADAPALGTVPSPPAAVSAAVEALRERLSAISAQRLGGRSRDAIVAANAARTTARQLAYGPALAESLVLVGQLRDDTGDFAGAADALRDGYWEALANAHDALAARAAVMLVKITGERLAELAVADRWARDADAVLRRTGDPAPERAALAHNTGAVLGVRGDHEAAVRLHRRGLEIREAALGTTHYLVGLSHNLVAGALADVQDHDAALTHGERALAILRREFGDAHPYVAGLRLNLGVFHYARGEFLLARAEYAAALKILERVHGSDHPDVAAAHNNLATVDLALGDYAAAIERFERALAIEGPRLGADHPDVAMYLLNLSMAHRGVNEPARALELAQRANDAFTRTLGERHEQVALALIELAAARTELGQGTQALVELRAAAAIQRETLPARHPHVVLYLYETGRALAQVGAHTEAIDHLRRAGSLQDELGGRDSVELVHTLVELARVQRLAGDHAAARASLLETLALLDAAQVGARRRAELRREIAELLAVDPEDGERAWEIVEEAWRELAEAEPDEAATSPGRDHRLPAHER